MRRRTLSDDLDLTLVSTMDQPVPFDASTILEAVEAVVQKSLDEHNPDVAFGAGATLIRAARLSGIGLAKLLYLVYSNWTKYEIDMDFYDAGCESLGMKRITLERYVRIWGMFDSGEVPETAVQTLLQRPMSDLNAVATAFASGFPITPEKWETIATAESGAAVLEIMREVKQSPPKGNTISLKLTRDGDIYAWYKGESFHVGWLDINDAEEHEPVKKAIDRIVSGSGIMRE